MAGDMPLGQFSGSESRFGSPPSPPMPDQTFGARSASLADARVSKSPGGQHRGSGDRRTGQFPHHAGSRSRHAAHDDGIWTAGSGGDAGNHLYFNRLV